MAFQIVLPDGTKTYKPDNAHMLFAVEQEDGTFIYSIVPGPNPSVDKSLAFIMKMVNALGLERMQELSIAMAAGEGVDVEQLLKDIMTDEEKELLEEPGE